MGKKKVFLPIPTLGLAVFGPALISAARAQEAAEPIVTVNAVNLSVREVLTTLAREAGVNILVDPRVPDTPISLSLTDAPLSRVFALICESAGLEVLHEGDTYYVAIDRQRFVTLPNLGEVSCAALNLPASILAAPVTLHVADAPIRQVLPQLGGAGLRVVVDESVPADLRVTASFQNTPFSRCLYMLLVPSGLYAQAVLETRPFTLRILGPMRVALKGSTVAEGAGMQYYPDNYRGALGYLLADSFWENPAHYGGAVSYDAFRQPQVWKLGSSPPPSDVVTPGGRPGNAPICAACGQTVQPAWRFCPHCGRSLGERGS